LSGKNCYSNRRPYKSIAVAERDESVPQVHGLVQDDVLLDPGGFVAAHQVELAAQIPEDGVALGHFNIACKKIQHIDVLKYFIIKKYLNVLK
jgi:hypothetical protein